MKKILSIANNVIFYFVTLLVLVITLPRSSQASCNSLVSYADQALCQKTASQYGIEEVELWRGGRSSPFSTIVTEGSPKLIVMERMLPGNGQSVSGIEGVQAGKLVLQQSDRRSTLPVLNEGTLVRLKRDSDKSLTQMLVLMPRSGLREAMGAESNSTMSTGDDEGTSGVNNLAIILPTAAIFLSQALGWIWTFGNIWDAYFYNGGGSEKLSVSTLILTAIMTFGTNLIPHLIIYKIKTPRAAPDPVQV